MWFGRNPLTTSQPDMTGIDLSSAYQSGEWTDLEITCKGHRWRVHRVVVCTQSDFFAAALRHDFKESRTNVIELEEESPGDIDCMLDFLYTGSTSFPLENVANKAGDDAQTGKPDNASDERRAPHRMSSTLRIYFLADRLGIAKLMEHAGREFGLALGRVVDDHFDIPSALQAIYFGTTSRSTHQHLRFLIVAKVVKIIDVEFPIFKEGILLKKMVLKALEDHPFFAYDVGSYQTTEKRALAAECKRLRERAAGQAAADQTLFGSLRSSRLFQ